MNTDKMVYMDHAATTPARTEVIEAMVPYLKERYGNPSSLYAIASEAKQAMENARAEVAHVINSSAGEIYFTSGGTESDNWAIIGSAYANRKKGTHLITSGIEHHAVTHTFHYLHDKGFKLTYIPVDNEGIIKLDAIEDAITPETTLVSVMAANNEIGTIQPVKEIGAICREKEIIFHTDAVQAVTHIPLDVEDMNVDLLSLSAHKFYGPKGIGALYIRKKTRIDSFHHGGGQETRKRAGTENVAGIVGMGKAITISHEKMPLEIPKEIKLRDYLIREIKQNISHTRLNGHPQKRLPGNVNMSIDFIEGESLVLLLDHKGIAASTGSACSSGTLEPSHVLLAIGLPHETAHGSVRFTLGEETTMDDIRYVVEVLPGLVERLRIMSPVYSDFCKRSEKNV